MRVILFVMGALGVLTSARAAEPDEVQFVAMEKRAHGSILSPGGSAGKSHSCCDPSRVDEELNRLSAEIAQVSQSPLSTEDRAARLKPLLSAVVHVIGHLSDAEVRGETRFARAMSRAVNLLRECVTPWRMVLNARRTLGIHRSDPYLGQHLPNILIMVVGTELLEKTSFLWIPAVGNSVLAVESPAALFALGVAGVLVNSLDLLCWMNPFIYVSLPRLQRALTWVRERIVRRLGFLYALRTWDRAVLLKDNRAEFAVTEEGEGAARRLRVEHLRTGATAWLMRDGFRLELLEFVADSVETARPLAQLLGWNARDAVMRALQAEHLPFYVSSIENGRVTFKPGAIVVSRAWRRPCEAALESSQSNTP